MLSAFTRKDGAAVMAAADPVQPRTLADTGLPEVLLTDLLCKHLFDAGALDVPRLSERMGLAGTVLDELIGILRRDMRVEVLGQSAGSNALRFGLTDRGRASARDALARSGYIGVAPYPIERYRELVRAQTVHHASVNAVRMRQAFSDVVLHEQLIDQLGASLNSGRAIMIYGPAGTGKTYISSRLIRLFDEHVWVPAAISINEVVIEVFDPQLHQRVDEDARPSVRLDQGHDRRLLRCRRPVVITGGELTLDQLDVRYDPFTRQYSAPLQLKASNGMFIIDDLGRQRMAPAELLNRWIVPMENQSDYLNLGGGRHVELPFDVILIFSTNLNPLELADEAFLRRIGYKVRFDYLTRDEYEQIWRQELEKLGIPFDSLLLRYVIEGLHQPENVPLLPCHPRDLLGMAVDRKRYLGREGAITPQDLEWAWRNYFVKLADAEQGDAS